jgi:hypothetical protein
MVSYCDVILAKSIIITNILPNYVGRRLTSKERYDTISKS